MKKISVFSFYSDNGNKVELGQVEECESILTFTKYELSENDEKIISEETPAYFNDTVINGITEECKRHSTIRQLTRPYVNSYRFDSFDDILKK